MTGGIYCLRNTHDGKRYVGQASDFTKRKTWHMSAMKHGFHFNRHMAAAAKMYGPDVFEWAVLEIVDEAMRDQRERAWIAYYQTEQREHGYNNESGGAVLKRHSADTRKLMSEQRKGKRRSVETIARIAAAKRNQSARTRLLISQANSRRRLTSETKAKIASAQTGRKASDSTKAKMSEAQKRRQERERSCAN